jgi:hypothetical protein
MAAPQSWYVLEYKDTLESETWTPLPAVLGNTGALILTDDQPAPTQRFYRLRVQ